MSIDLMLIECELAFRAGDPKPLAMYLREYGLPKDQAGFVADVIEGKFKRTKADTHYAQRTTRLRLLRACIFHYEMMKPLFAENPKLVPCFRNLDEVYQFVAEHFHTTSDAIVKLHQREMNQKKKRKDRDK